MIYVCVYIYAHTIRHCWQKQTSRQPIRDWFKGCSILRCYFICNIYIYIYAHTQANTMGEDRLQGHWSGSGSGVTWYGGFSSQVIYICTYIHTHRQTLWMKTNVGLPLVQALLNIFELVHIMYICTYTHADAVGEDDH